MRIKEILLLPIIFVICLPGIIGEKTGLWKYRYPGTAEAPVRFFICLFMWIVVLGACLGIWIL